MKYSAIYAVHYYNWQWEGPTRPTAKQRRMKHKS